MNLQYRNFGHVGAALGFAMVLSSLLTPSIALATTQQGISGIASNITSNFSELTKLITATAYLAGVGFAVGAILKFKQHKDNPTQIPIGTPVAMLAVAIAMIFLPSIIGITSQTVFSGAGSEGGASGVTI